MAIVVVGGQTRNIGKTSVVAGLIAALPEKQWTAIKITQTGRTAGVANGEPRGCETAEPSVSEERDRASGADTSRYLAAGAARSFWVRTPQGRLSDAMPQVRRLIAAAENVVIESNSVLRFLQPDVSLSVFNPWVADFKASALRSLDRVDALVLPEGAVLESAWSGVALGAIAEKPRFFLKPPVYCSAELVAFVAGKLDANLAR